MGKKVRNFLFKNWFWFFYIIILLAIFYKNVLINNFNAVKMLFGFRNPWFIFAPGGPTDIIPIPEPGDGTVLPTFPEPDFGKVTIVTGDYWKVFIDRFFRVAILLLLLWILIFTISFFIKKLELISKKQNTLPYLLYKKIKPFFMPFVIKVKKIVNHILINTLNKKNIIYMILIALLIQGALLNIVFSFILSFIAVFKTGPYNWLVLHAKAIVYGLFVFLNSFTIINLVIVISVLYIAIAFVNAYTNFALNEILLETFVNDLPFGVQITGGSGAKKTATMQALASAGHRNARKQVKKWMNEIESAYGMFLSFNDVKYYFELNKENIKNSADAQRYARKFISEYRIENHQLDRFKGETPDLYDRIKWYFVALWIIQKTTILMLSLTPTIINDPSIGEEVRSNAYDVLTARRSPIRALILNQNVIKKSLNAIEAITHDDDTVTHKIKDGAEKEEINFSLEPCMQIMWPEMDKDFPFSSRGEIIQEGQHEIAAILRHFLSFDNRTWGHFFYDSQARDGVANVIRSKFDFTLSILEGKTKHSLFLIPFIKYYEWRLATYTKIRKVTEEFSPYKNSFLRTFLKWREKSLIRKVDFLTSFDYWQMRVRPQNSAGETKGKEVKIRLNLAHVFYQYASVTYQAPYEDMKKRFATFKYENLVSWQDDMKLHLEDLRHMHSDFANSVFGQKTDKQLEEERKKKAKKKKKGSEVTQNDVIDTSNW